MKRLVFFLVVGLGGVAILISLGVWQMQRLAWKQAILERIERTIMDEPIEFAEFHRRATETHGAHGHMVPSGVFLYMPVKMVGTVGSEFIRVLVSKKDVGAGYRIISTFDTDQGVVLVDWGFIKTSKSTDHLMPDNLGEVSFTGNLHWPSETDSYTPDPDIEENIWFARDLDQMFPVLKPDIYTLVVARTSPLTEYGVTPMPIDTAGIPNNHLQYAITWFSLAAIWLMMSLYFLRPTKQSSTKQSRDI
jgi:surfeit locus 1 family protein